MLCEYLVKKISVYPGVHDLLQNKFIEIISGFRRRLLMWKKLHIEVLLVVERYYGVTHLTI